MQNWIAPVVIASAIAGIWTVNASMNARTDAIVKEMREARKEHIAADAAVEQRVVRDMLFVEAIRDARRRELQQAYEHLNLRIDGKDK